MTTGKVRVTAGYRVSIRCDAQDGPPGVWKTGGRRCPAEAVAGAAGARNTDVVSAAVTAGWVYVDQHTQFCPRCAPAWVEAMRTRPVLA